MVAGQSLHPVDDGKWQCQDCIMHRVPR